MIGSMPQTDANAASAMVKRFLKTMPVWPQLPGRAFMEHMNVQFSEGFPGFTIEGNKYYIKRSGSTHESLEKLYNAYLSNDASNFPTGIKYAAGLYAFLSSEINSQAVKGQIVGPVTWGLSVTTENNKAIIYDDVLGDAVPKFLRLKAAWQEKALRKLSPNTIIFVDEPYMASFGSSTVPLSKERVIELLDEVFKGINGLKGIHCCGNTDWPVLLATKTDIISFDAYNYAQPFALYPAETKKFLARDGVIAWGIVPNTPDALKKETAASLKDRLEEAMVPFTMKGIPIRKLTEQGLLTPSCGLAGLTPDAAERALELLAELSLRINSACI